MRKYSLLLVPLLVLALLRILLQFNGLYGQDPHYYFHYSQELTSYLAGGSAPSLEFFWPILYPLVGSIPSLIGGTEAFWLQLTSCLSIGVAAVFVAKTLALLYPDKSRYSWYYVLLTFVLSPFVLRSGMVVMSDALCVALVAVALYHTISYGKEQKLKHVVYAVACIAAGFSTRYAAAVLLAIPGIYLVATTLSKKKWLHVLAGIAVLLICLLPHYLIKGEHAGRFLQHGVLGEWSLLHMFSRDFVTSEGNLHYTLPNICYVLYNFGHPGYFLLGLPLLLFVRLSQFRSKPQLLLIATFAAYALFMVGVPNQNPRFLLISFPIAVLLFYPAYLSAVEKFGDRKLLWVASAGVVVAVQLGLFGYTFLPFWQANQFERYMGNSLKTYPHENVLYTFGMDLSLKSYDAPQRIVNMYDEKIESYEIGGLVLFAPEKFAEQWEGQMQMINWEALNEQYHLEQLHQYPGSWIMYKIESKK